MEKNNVRCSVCDTALCETSGNFENSPCPNCGSTARTISVTLTSTLGVLGSWGLKLKRPELPSAKKLRVESFSGYEFSAGLRKMVKKIRVIDRDKKHYFEEVTDIQTGEVIHRCEHPLPEHVGHGSAKRK